MAMMGSVFGPNCSQHKPGCQERERESERERERDRGRESENKPESTIPLGCTHTMISGPPIKLHLLNVHGISQYHLSGNQSFSICTIENTIHIQTIAMYIKVNELRMSERHLCSHVYCKIVNSQKVETINW
jgi:hypothetical protein